MMTLKPLPGRWVLSGSTGAGCRFAKKSEVPTMRPRASSVPSRICQNTGMPRLRGGSCISRGAGAGAGAMGAYQPEVF